MTIMIKHLIIAISNIMTSVTVKIPSNTCTYNNSSNDRNIMLIITTIRNILIRILKAISTTLVIKTVITIQLKN